MKELKDMSLQELGGYVCSALMKHKIHVVLSGGSCVEIYSRGDYTTCDLDFINQYNEKKQSIREIMLDLNFREYERYYIHDDIEHLVEFPAGPLGVGDTPVDEISEVKTDAGVLRMLTPTDCIKDRLAAFYHWGDEQCLQQAVWVAQKNSFDIDSIEAWSIDERMGGKFIAFSQLLK